MQQKGVQPYVFTYSASISACEKGGQWERALQLLAEMQQKGVQPNVITYSAVIEVLERSKQREKVDEVYGQALRGGHYHHREHGSSHRSDSDTLTMDLHDFPTAVALASVRHVLRSLQDRKALVIITGQGHGSASNNYQSVLREPVQQMIRDEFPPLEATLHPTNPGRLVVQGLQRWFEGPA
jgi:pentatricopeptide repeat protein